MKFSTKSRYALRLMAELARYAPGTTVSLKEISERQNLRLPPDQSPRRLHRRRDPARHRGQRGSHPLPWQ